jgi:serine/threonine protein kinase
MPSTVSGSSTDDYPEGGEILESPNLRVFTFAELKSATKSFRPETVLGEGGFGKVYKGWVDVNPSKGSTTMVVAVKKLNPESVQGMEQWQVIIDGPDPEIKIGSLYYIFVLLRYEFQW